MGCLGSLTVMLCIRLERTANGRPYSANPSAPCFRQTSPRRAEGGLRGKRGFRPKDRMGGAPFVPQNDLRSLGFGAAAPMPVQIISLRIYFAEYGEPIQADGRWPSLHPSDSNAANIIRHRVGTRIARPQKPPLCKGRWHAKRDGGIVPPGLPAQSPTALRAEPPLHKGAFSSPP